MPNPNIGQGMPQGDAWLVRRLEALERAVREQASAQTLSASTISAGGVTVLDTSGNTRTVIDTGGVRIYDPSGNLVVQLGQLNSSPNIYGLGVLPAGGTTLQLVGGQISTPSLTVSTSNVAGTWNSFGGSSTITATIGPSGQCQIGGGFQITTIGGLSGGGSDAVISLRLLIDGTTSVPFLLLGIPFTTGAPLLSYTGGAPIPVSGLTPGSHTFVCQWNIAAAGQTQSTTMTGSAYVQPL